MRRRLNFPLKADGRPPERGGIEGPHSHIVRVSNMGTEESDTGFGAWPRRGPKGAPGTRHQPGGDELESDRILSRGAAKNQKIICYYKYLRHFRKKSLG